MISTIQLFRDRRLNGFSEPPGDRAHPAVRLAWLIDQPNIFGLRDEITGALYAIEEPTRGQLAAACEAKLFPDQNSRTGLSPPKIEMLRMLQSVYGGR